MGEDQPLGLFPKSSRSPSCWCPISRGKPDFDLPWFSHHCETTSLPLFQDWTFATLTSLPSVSQVGEQQPPLSHTLPAPSAFQSFRVTTSAPSDSIACATPSTATILQPLHSSPVPRLSGAHLARPSAHLSTRSVHRMARATASPPPSRPAPPSLPPVLPGADNQANRAGHLSSPSHSGAPPFAPVVAHVSHAPCHSRRCPHRLSVPQPIPPVAASRPARPRRTCRASGCSSPHHANCSVGFCSTHCTTQRCQRRSPPPMQSRCRRDCLEPAPPDCPVGFCNLHCTSPRCVVRDPLFLSGSGQGAARRRPQRLSFITGLGQLNCRRLWGRDGSVHDGFMGLVSCLDQLGLHVFCVQETQSPLVSSWISLFGVMALLAAMVARQVSCSTLHSAVPYPWDARLTVPSLASHLGLSSCLVIFVRHMLALPLTHTSNSGAHLQPQSIMSRSSHRHPTSACGGLQHLVHLFSCSVVRDRLVHLFCPLYRKSCSLIPWCFGTHLMILLTFVVPLWTSFSPRLLSQTASLSTLVPSAAHLRLSVASCFLPTTYCALVIFTFPRLLYLLIQPILPYPMCATGKCGCHHSLSTWHQSVLAHVSGPLPDFPARALFDSLT